MVQKVHLVLSFTEKNIQSLELEAVKIELQQPDCTYLRFFLWLSTDNCILLGVSKFEANIKLGLWGITLQLFKLYITIMLINRNHRKMLIITSEKKNTFQMINLFLLMVLLLIFFTYACAPRSWLLSYFSSHKQILIIIHTHI